MICRKDKYIQSTMDDAAYYNMSNTFLITCGVICNLNYNVKLYMVDVSVTHYNISYITHNNKIIYIFMLIHRKCLLARRLAGFNISVPS